MVAIGADRLESHIDILAEERFAQIVGEPLPPNMLKIDLFKGHGDDRNLGRQKAGGTAPDHPGDSNPVAVR